MKSSRQKSIDALYSKSSRRFNSNKEAWSFKPPPSYTIRNESSRTKRPTHNYKSLDALKTKLSEYKRVAESTNDPYVQVTLKPYDESIQHPFRTNVIYGGGCHVQWNGFSDDNEHTFLLQKHKEILNSKYLKIEVFDYETYAKDRCLGVATIITEQLTQNIGKPHYAVLDLYENNIESQYAWAGTVEIMACLKKVELDADEPHNSCEATADTNIQQKRYRQTRAFTDALVLGDHSRSTSDNRDEDHLTLIQHEQTVLHNANMHRNAIQGRVIDVVLFLSLLLSGTLFFGAMNEYEVDAQALFIKQTQQTN